MNTLSTADLVSSPAFAEHHERVIDAPRPAVERAMLEVTTKEVRVLGPLYTLRSLPARIVRTGRQASRTMSEGLHPDRPLLDEMSSGFEVFVRDAGLLLVGGIGQPYRLRGGVLRRVGTPAAFASFTEPGFCRIAMEIRLIERDGTLKITTDTVVGCTDPATVRAFRPYWWLIRLPSGAIRRSWLSAISRRARAAQMRT